ncbi:UNVERIFIED_ORG: membrane protein involved in colicin uptake [Arthrobacter globiformis]|nr:membrane protein involved in colicin uptake [Arthrobacter globiformis]
MTARKTPASRKPATPAIKLSGDMVEVPSEALANEAAAANSIAQDVEAPADEVAEAINELEAEANKKAAPVKKAPANAAIKKAPAPTSHANCTHAKSGAEGKKARAACRREKAAEAAKQAKK